MLEKERTFGIALVTFNIKIKQYEKASDINSLTYAKLSGSFCKVISLADILNNIPHIKISVLWNLQGVFEFRQLHMLSFIDVEFVSRNDLRP